MLLHLKALLARSLGESETSVTTIEDEIGFVRDYLVIEQERFGDRLRVAYEIDPALLPIRVPVLSLQPLVENAIRHGISTSIEGGLVRVIVRGTPDGCDLVVEDDGPGPDGLSLEGTGLENVRQRLHATLGPGATLTLERTAGHLPVTRATIHIP
jgi:two-component system LytT family sensor kinase